MADAVPDPLGGSRPASRELTLDVHPRRCQHASAPAGELPLVSHLATVRVPAGSKDRILELLVGARVCNSSPQAGRVFLQRIERHHSSPFIQNRHASPSHTEAIRSRSAGVIAVSSSPAAEKNT